MLSSHCNQCRSISLWTSLERGYGVLLSCREGCLSGARPTTNVKPFLYKDFDAEQRPWPAQDGWKVAILKPKTAPIFSQ